MGAVNSVVESVGNIVGGAVDTVSELASSIDDVVNDVVPGGWATVATVAIPGAGATLGTALGLEGTAASLAGNTLIQTAANGGDLEQGLVNAGLGSIGGAIAAPVTTFTEAPVLGNIAGSTATGLLAGKPLEQALTGGLINAGINTASAELANQTPADFEADINKALDTSASIPVSAFESDINQVLDLPATQPPSIFVDTTAPELPSGMDLSSDIGPTANTVEDVSQALAGEGTAVSGQDLAADATPGNTLQDVSTALTPAVTPVEEKPGLSKEQIASLLKTGLGLFGGITAASKALSSVPSINSILNTQSVVNAPTPFTGTYSGMNMTNPEYFQQVQQNYNRLFPNTPADVATPLQAWYSTEYKPETPVIKSLFGL